LLWCGLLASLLVAVGASAQDVPASRDGQVAQTPRARTLTLAEVQLSGATRTSLSTVYRYLRLRPGQPIDQTTLVESVAELRAGNLFQTVSFYTKPGAARGQLILVLEVEEHSLDFRWAAGNTNLDGWYLVPAMLAYDNAFGKGGLFDLHWRIGFRHTGVLLRYGQPRAGDGRTYWGARLGSISTDRPYFQDDVEFRHVVNNSGLAAVLGRRLGGGRTAELGLAFEHVSVSHTATAFTTSADGTIEADQEIPEDELPPAIQAAIGDESRAIVHLDLQRDSRTSERRAGSPVGGVWGRVKGRFIGQKDRSHVGLQTDLRAFQEVPGGVLAARVRGAWVGKQAAFYDRLYLGGMYTVRGFPTHALSAPGGDTWLWSGSLEYRSRILGDAKGTKLAGVLFLDAGDSGAPDSDDPYPGVAASAGYGVRMRVWWLDWLGLDVGFPLTERPLDMRFQVTASIGWSF
jgi:outer membrane protein assembly factor BamA